MVYPSNVYIAFFAVYRGNRILSQKFLLYPLIALIRHIEGLKVYKIPFYTCSWRLRLGGQSSWFFRSKACNKETLPLPGVPSRSTAFTASATIAAPATIQRAALALPHVTTTTWQLAVPAS